MKIKKIKKIAPVQPKKKEEYAITVQKEGDILILNVFFHGDLKGRHALNPVTGEYSQYCAVKETWSQQKFGRLLGLNMNWANGYYSSREQEERTVFDSYEQEEMVREALEVKKTISWCRNTFEMINEAEREYHRDRREKTENNRRMRIQDKMRLVPKLPEDVREWIWKQDGERDYAFFLKDKGKWHCTGCGREYEEKALAGTGKKGKAKHNDVSVCPECGRQVTVKKRVGKMEVKTHFSLLQKMNEKMSVCRHFDVKMIWDTEGRSVRINEAMRIVLYHVSTLPRHAAEIFYNQYCTDGAYGGVTGWEYEYAYFDNKGNPANRSSFAGYLYPEGIEEALKDTAYQAWGRLFAQLAGAGRKLNYNRLLTVQNDTHLIGVVECLHKGRFGKLLEETAERVSYWDSKYTGILDKRGRNIEEVFKIPDRQMINRIRDVDGGEEMVKWMRWSWKHKQKISQELLEWLSKNNVTQGSINFIEGRMSLQQVMNYITRQQKEGYGNRTVNGVLEQWKDYLGMLERLGKKADDEMMYRPRELKRRHDECVEEVRKQQMIEQMKRDARQRAEEARKMREKFPGAEEILKEIKDKYEYGNEEYTIVVPKDFFEIITDGQTLHHCAASSDRYFDRIVQRETYICFLRKTEDPQIPYYTIEVEPGGTIRQHRGMYDEEPEIEKIKPFLREWQKEIKKRMGRKEKEYARISAQKRQANIEELKAKNNTKVLNGLMEDFMEAI